MANETIRDSTRAARTLTPDAERTEAALLRPRPSYVALRLQFSYVIHNGTFTMRKPSIVETLGFLFPAEVNSEQQIQAMETALRAGGAILPDTGLAGSWNMIDVGSRLCSTALTQIGSGQDCNWTVDSKERAIEVFAERARTIGAHVAEIGGAVGWRRVDEVQGAQSVMHGLKLLFEELGALNEALNDARELGASIAKPVAGVKPRPL